MRRNYNLELRLLPAAAGGFGLPDWCGKEEEEEQQMTIFYNGKVAVCDVTELQARAIISFASREMEEKSRTLSSSSEPSSPVLQSPIYGPAAGLSMKRSLQRFLQKRKNRIQAAFPYHHL
ncbi:protein TIFY 5A-like [Coffea arabica]|uniref:Protein TIFY n=1 Tax=Coffea arabica TaxID=13443 RepID=A0A6P6VH56_COFAR|nr:protein TIFY 5A-like [Coffea arabica]